jgi:rhodanese-related sulfurtransferase
VRQSHPLLEEVDPPTLAAALAGDDPPLLVDVRTDPERAVAVIEPSLHIGLDRFVERAPAEIPQDRGWARVRSLAGGIDAWSEQVDPEIPRYR